MILELERQVRDCWSDLDPGVSQPARLHFLKLGSEDYPPPSSALVFLAFADHSARPVAVVKAARIPAGDDAVRHEADGLERVRPLLPEPLARVVPRLLRRGTVNGREFFLCSAVPGRSEIDHAWTAARLLRVSGHIVSGLRWALDVAFAAPAPALSPGEWLDLDSPESVLAALAARGSSDEDLRLLEPRLREMWGLAWPCGPAHGDFWGGNMLFEKRALSGVVDWNFAAVRAPVFTDVLTFEIAFSVSAVYGGGALDLEKRRQVHELPPLVEVRQRLLERGVDIGLDSSARFAVLVAAALSDRGAWVSRERVSRAYVRLLALEAAAARAGRTAR